MPERKKLNAWEKEHLEFLATVPEIFEIIHYFASVLDLRKV